MIPEKLGNKNPKRDYMDAPRKGKQTRLPEKIRREEEEREEGDKKEIKGGLKRT